MRRVYFIGNWFALNNGLSAQFRSVFGRYSNKMGSEMTKLESKSDPFHSWNTIRQFLDVIRHVIIITATIMTIYFLWKIHWLLAIVVVFSTYILLVNVFGFLTLPLYALIPYGWSSLTPEGKAMSEKWKRLEKGETEPLRELAKRTGKEH